MRWSDILRSSLQNLTRRKLRSMLTMLGVVIGTATIVVTISLGYGAQKTQMDAMASQTNMRLISVYPNPGGGYGEDSATGRRVAKITDRVVLDIRRMKGVTAVTPMVYFWTDASMILTTGKYSCYTSLVGVFPADFAKIQKLKSGNYFTANLGQMEFIMSEMSMINFSNPKTPTEYPDVYGLLDAGKELPLPPINWLTAKYTMAMTRQDWSKVDAANPDPVATEKDYRAKMVGVIGAEKYGTMFDYGAIVNLSWLKKMVAENKNSFFKDSQLPAMDSYDTLYLLADSVDSVEGLTKALKEYGLMANSPMDWITSTMDQIRMMQGFMAFIGAISMMVAALSIANTMMMSIYERTREIGVMKVLGCRLNNIRMLFLSEAAYIGLFGGALGLLVSFGLSYALNNVKWLQDMVSGIMGNTGMWTSTDSPVTASIIPPMLALYAWAGVIAVSLASGLYPASRAMKLSSLAAIRNAD